MAKVFVVESAPEELEKGEIVVTLPSFLNEVSASRRTASGKLVTSLNHLRDMATNVGDKYDPEFNPYSIPYVNYTGLEYKDDNDLNTILNVMFAAHYPNIIDKAIEHQIQTRPANTSTIYFVGPDKYLGVFFKNGIARGDA